MRPVELDYQLWLPANLAPLAPHILENQRYILTEPSTPIANLRPTAASRSFPDFKAEVIRYLSGTRNDIPLGGLLQDLDSEGALDWRVTHNPRGRYLTKVIIYMRNRNPNCDAPL
ncbi:hypothetical protein PSTT_14451, partial [Puccinia striiformis]